MGLHHRRNITIEIHGNLTYATITISHTIIVVSHAACGYLL